MLKIKNIKWFTNTTFPTAQHDRIIKVQCDQNIGLPHLYLNLKLKIKNAISIINQDTNTNTNYIHLLEDIPADLNAQYPNLNISKLDYNEPVLVKVQGTESSYTYATANEVLHFNTDGYKGFHLFDITNTQVNIKQPEQINSLKMLLEINDNMLVKFKNMLKTGNQQVQTLKENYDTAVKDMWSSIDNVLLTPEELKAELETKKDHSMKLQKKLGERRKLVLDFEKHVSQEQQVQDNNNKYYSKLCNKIKRTGKNVSTTINVPTVSNQEFSSYFPEGKSTEYKIKNCVAAMNAYCTAEAFADKWLNSDHDFPEDSVTESYVLSPYSLT